MATEIWWRNDEDAKLEPVEDSHPLPVKLPSTQETLLGVERLLTEQNLLLRQMVLGLSLLTGANLKDTA